MVVSLLFSELFGLAVGGMVVPGYIAMYLDRPRDVAMTIAASLATFLMVRVLASVVIIYGRRRTVIMILVGYLCGAMLRGVQGTIITGFGSDTAIIGYIIPGLIAIWMDRQGLWETLTAMFTGAVVVRLILIIFMGAELN